MIRQTLIFSGRVQGVGFRYTTALIARRFDVAGYVQNLSDGQVCVVVEGAKADVDTFVQAVCERMSRNITDFTKEEVPATMEFGNPRMADTFTVRY